MMRLLTNQDILQLRALRLEALKTDPDVFVASYETELEKTQNYYEWLVDNNIIAGAFDDDILYAMTMLTRTPSPKMQHRALRSMTFVKPSHRRQGAAKKIIEFIHEEAIKNGIRTVTVGLFSSNISMMKLNPSIGYTQQYIEKAGVFHDGKYHDFAFFIKYLVETEDHERINTK